MNYVITASIDWADEFDVHFFEVMDEETYKKYEFLKQTLHHYYTSYCFGTNEDFDEFEPLDFTPKPITDEELAVLNKFDIKGEDRIIENLFYALEDDLSGVNYAGDLLDMEYGEFCQLITDNLNLLQ